VLSVAAPGVQRRKLNVRVQCDSAAAIISQLYALKKCAVNPGLTWSQPGVSLGSTWGQNGVNLGSTWGQPWVNLGSTWGEPGVNSTRLVMRTAMVSDPSSWYSSGYAAN